MRARKLVAGAVYCAVTAAVVTATTAYVRADKSVAISIDGQTRHIRTFASSVGAVLARAHLTVGEHDSLSPAPSARVADGATITILRGRPLELTVDGQTRQVWVTARSVEEALMQVGLRANGAVVSADRSDRVPLSGMSISIDLPHTFSVQADGKTRVLVSAKPTLGAALAEAGIVVNPADQISAPLTDRPVDGLTVVIVRVTSGEQLENSPIPFTTVTQQDPNAYVGTRTVAQQGQNGTLVSTYKLVFADGKQTGKTLVGQQVAAQPVQQIIAVGTKPKPKPQPVYNVPADGLNWAALARCESGGRANATDPPYYGLYQFTLGTWQAVGGHGLPSQASPSEQTYRAQLLYQRSNWRTQWPVCGHLLFS